MHMAVYSFTTSCCFISHICSLISMCRFGRAVKATDLKSVGVSPRRFKSCSRRFFIFVNLTSYITNLSLVRLLRQFISRHSFHDFIIRLVSDSITVLHTRHVSLTHFNKLQWKARISRESSRDQLSRPAKDQQTPSTLIIN